MRLTVGDYYWRASGDPMTATLRFERPYVTFPVATPHGPAHTRVCLRCGRHGGTYATDAEARRCAGLHAARCGGRG